jgi:hypothetical protein
MTDLQKEIAVSRKRIESWSKQFTQQLKGEIDRFSIYVKDQCDLHKLRIFEELDALQHRLEDQTAISIDIEHRSNFNRNNTSQLNVKTERREVDETPKKRTRQATKIYSPESQQSSTRGRFKSPHSSSNLEHSRHSSTRSLRKKSRVSYTYHSESETSDEEHDEQETSKSPDNFHQLLSSNICSHLVSSNLVSSLPSLPPPSLSSPTVIPLASQLPQSRAPSLELLEIYQSYIMKLLTTPTPQKFQFRHYQDIYYLWGGYYQTRPYAMSYKLLMDLLHFFSDQNNYDGKSNTRYMRQAIYNLLRSGDLVLLDSTDESSVFISLDDEKECISSSKHMIALPLSQTIVRKHLKDDQVVIDELAQLFYEIYDQLLSSSKTTNAGSKADSAPPPAAAEHGICLSDLQKEFISSIQSGKCQALSDRYPNNEGAEEKISWEYYLPPNEHWRRYRRYEMVDIASFHKYLEAEGLISVTKTSKSEFIQWIGEEEDSESEGQHESI